MDAVVALMGGLLSLLHGTLNVTLCPGDWIWTTIAAGALIVAAPVIGTMLAALLRRFIGNRYTPGVAAAFVALALSSTLLLPWLAFSAVSQVFGRLTAGGNGRSGLTAADFHSIARSYCFLPRQDQLLGANATVAQVLAATNKPLSFGGYAVTVGLLPLLCLFFVRWQARVAFRRGPVWPTRLFWLSFVLMAVFTARLSANVVGLLWAGFLPASMVGVLAVRLIGAPSWAVINRPAETPPPPLPLEEPSPPRPSPPARLADTPGPLPAALVKQVPPAGTLVAPASAAANPGPLGSFAGGRFRPVRQLGRGGFGQVWLAMDTNLGRMVAVKIAHASDAESGQRMHREARALAALHHPNCVRVYDLVEGPEGLAIVMEYIEGDSLAEVLRSRRGVDDTAAARLWVTMAGALAAAHGSGVLHRDVKPGNVIIDAAGVAHLIDFGIARSRGDSTLTATGMMLGTPDFLAPEVARGGPASPESDSWQLAATVSFALTGQPPRGARDTVAAALLAAANGAAITTLPERSVHRQLLAAALATDPTRRPPLAVVMRQLEAWLARAGLSSDGPVTTVIPPLGQRPAPLPRRSGPPVG